MTIIEELWRKAIARQVRQNCTLPEWSDDAIRAVADWIEHPPEWSKFSAPSVSPAQLYEQMRAETVEDYRNPKWAAGRRWLRRVGVPKLTAQSTAWFAAQLLKTISRRLYRNEPELDALLIAAREAAAKYYREASHSGWRRFKGDS